MARKHRVCLVPLSGASSTPRVWPDWEVKAPSLHGWVGVLEVLREPAGSYWSVVSVLPEITLLSI